MKGRKVVSGWGEGIRKVGRRREGSEGSQPLPIGESRLTAGVCNACTRVAGGEVGAWVNTTGRCHSEWLLYFCGSQAPPIETYLFVLRKMTHNFSYVSETHAHSQTANYTYQKSQAL